MQFLHFGVPTQEEKPGMNLLEALGVYVTDPSADPFMIEWLRFLLRQDLAALTVHLRTKKEMSKALAHHELIPEIVALRNEVAPRTRLHMNGDIMDRASGERLAREFGFDGVMIGRGVLVDPYCFATA